MKVLPKELNVMLQNYNQEKKKKTLCKVSASHNTIILCNASYLPYLHLCTRKYPCFELTMAILVVQNKCIEEHGERRVEMEKQTNLSHFWTKEVAFCSSSLALVCKALMIVPSFYFLSYFIFQLNLFLKMHYCLICIYYQMFILLH